MPVLIDDDTIDKFISGIYSAKWLRSWFLLQRQVQLEKQQTQLSVGDGQEPSPHEKLVMLLNSVRHNEFAVTTWEKNFLIDNEENEYLSEGPKGQIAMVEKLWRRYKI